MKRNIRLTVAVLTVILTFFLNGSSHSAELKELKLKVNEVEFSMMPCPAGTFTMGSPEDELGRDTSEIQHQVTLTKDFYIGRFPVTLALYKDVMGDYPEDYTKESASEYVASWTEDLKNTPAGTIAWADAVEFCNKLNELTANTRPAGYLFDLPTEAQWEYACRAGTTTSLNSGKNITAATGICPNLDELGWYYQGDPDDYDRYETHPVGLKKPNAWGIYDMHCNIKEWCSDWYDSYPSDSCTDPEVFDEPVIVEEKQNCDSDDEDGDCHCGDEDYNTTGRVIRGGDWLCNPGYCRSASRGKAEPCMNSIQFGIRLALVQKRNTEKTIAKPKAEKGTWTMD